LDHHLFRKSINLIAKQMKQQMPRALDQIQVTYLVDGHLADHKMPSAS